MADETKMSAETQTELRSRLRLLAGQALGLLEVLDRPTPLVSTMLFAESLQSAARAVLELGITPEQAITYAANLRHGEIVLHDLDSMRAPDSPEGLT